MANNFAVPDEMGMEEAQAVFESNSTSIQIDCDFGGRIAPFPVYVGDPKPDSHPLQHQANWLQVERGGTIPPDVMASFETLQKIARENGVSFQMLCVYAFGEVQASQQENADAFTMSPPETPEMIPAEPEAGAEDPNLPPLPNINASADADAAAAMAAFNTHQGRIEQQRDFDEDAPRPSTPPIQG